MGDWLEVNRNFAGYRIEQLLGRGGCGEVYLAYDENLRRRVALKLLDRRASSDDVSRKRFEREAVHAARLDHPGIVTVFNRGEEEDRPWITMAYIGGRDVGRVVDSGPLSPQWAVHLIAQVADALDYAHSAGVLHRDVKPSNIMVTGPGWGRAVLTDFGIAKAVDESTALTRTDEVVASFQYAAPERLMSPDEVDHRSDVYSLGCTLYCMLTGQPPFKGSEIGPLIYAHTQGPIPVPSQHNPWIPKALDTVVGRALAKDPADRFASCGDLARHVAAALDGADARKAVGSDAGAGTTPARGDRVESDPPVLYGGVRTFLSVLTIVVGGGLVLLDGLISTSLGSIHAGVLVYVALIAIESLAMYGVLLLLKR